MKINSKKFTVVSFLFVLLNTLQIFEMFHLDSIDIDFVEKTLQLLFRGANKTEQDDEIQNSDLIPIERKDGMKQLFIGKDGSLLHSGSMVYFNLFLHFIVHNELF